MTYTFSWLLEIFEAMLILKIKKTHKKPHKTKSNHDQNSDYATFITSVQFDF